MMDFQFSDFSGDEVLEHEKSDEILEIPEILSEDPVVAEIPESNTASTI